jgi:hypothetical protein
MSYTQEVLPPKRPRLTRYQKRADVQDGNQSELSHARAPRPIYQTRALPSTDCPRRRRCAETDNGV